MRSCREPTCLGWPLMSSDQYCSWCGQRLVEVEAHFESKLGDQWVVLDPPVLNRERPPSLRLLVRHSGEAGHLRLRPGDFQLTAPWIDLDYSSLGDEPLKPGDSVHFPVRKLKVPGPEDLPHEVRVVLKQQEVRASASLTFVPAPEFLLELSSSEVVLASDAEPFLEGALVLRRGRVWLQSPPRLEPPLGELEAHEGQELELDALERPRYSFRFRFSGEELARLRQRSADPHQALRREAKVVFSYLDRGQKGSGSLTESLSGELPLQLQFLLAPELYLEPFGYELRRDWFVVMGLAHATGFALTVHNGPPGSAPRQPLQLQQLRVRDLDQGEDFPLEGEQPAPWTIQSDQPLDLRIRLPRELRQSADSQLQRRLQLIPVSNDPVQRLFHLRFQAERAEVFPGYLVVDLGTTATCAALVHENKAVDRVPLEGVKELPSAVCYLRWSQEQRWEVGQKALIRSLEPAAERSVILQAKRRVGDDNHPYEVVPLDEPSETITLTATQALSHLYREVFDQTLEHRLGETSSEVLIEKVLITHPSRFSLRQVELLKQAAHEALIQHWERWTGQRRSDLPEPLTLHEPVGAAFHFLKDWQNLKTVHARLGHGEDPLTWHLLVYDLGGGTLDVTLVQLQSVEQPCQTEPEPTFAYHVIPQVIGATGERWFGGQDVTQKLHSMVVDVLTEVLDDWAWPDPEQGGAQRVAWQRNHNLLNYWSENFKLALVRGEDPESGWAQFPALTCWERGRERLVTASHWRQKVRLPGLEQLETAVEPLVRNSIERIRHMLERLPEQPAPEVVLRVGKASQLPCIGRALESAFPTSLHVAPQQLKGCVVEGACLPPLPGLPSGVQLSRGVRRPGVRFRWKPQESYTATTCRLGFQVLDSGECWFQEVIPEGTPIPPGGLKRSLEGLYLEAGPSVLVFLENAGHEDALVVDGKPNGDIQVLARAQVEIPELGPDQMEQFQLVFHLQSNWALSVRLEAPGWEGLEVLHLDGSQLGRQY